MWVVVRACQCLNCGGRSIISVRDQRRHTRGGGCQLLKSVTRVLLHNFNQWQWVDGTQSAHLVDGLTRTDTHTKNSLDLIWLC